MISYINERMDDLSYLPKPELSFLESRIKSGFVKKDAFLCREGKICQTIYCIVQGSVRVYYINNQGNEITCDFLFENNLVISFTSFITQKPSNLNIVALEDSEILILGLVDFQALLGRHPCWLHTWNKLAIEYILKLKDREEMLILDNFDMRYKRIFNVKPILFQRVAQHYIASYLGMTPETLSRVKRRVHLKDL